MLQLNYEQCFRKVFCQNFSRRLLLKQTGYCTFEVNNAKPDLTKNLDPLLISVAILYPLKKPENQKAFGLLLFPGGIIG